MLLRDTVVVSTASIGRISSLMIRLQGDIDLSEMSCNPCSDTVNSVEITTKIDQLIMDADADDMHDADGGVAAGAARVETADDAGTITAGAASADCAGGSIVMVADAT
jgi:hypothetical protein